MKYGDAVFPPRNISKSLCRPSAWTVPSWPVFQCKYQSELLIQDLGQCASSIEQALILTSYIKIWFFFFWNLSAPESVVLFLSVAVFSVTTSPSPSVRTSFARVRGRKKNLFLSATSRWGPPLWSWYRRTSPVGWRTCSTRSPEGCIRGSWWRCAACQPWTACASCSTCSSGARSSSWGLRGGRERSKFYHSYSAQAFDLFFLYAHRTHAIHILTSTGQRLWMRTARTC